MSEIASLLRLLVQSDKEFKVSSLTVSDSITSFSSQLTSGYSRRRIRVKNNSSPGSGECYYGASNVSINNGFPLLVGEEIDLQIANNLNIYFISNSGETSDIRIFEAA